MGSRGAGAIVATLSPYRERSPLGQGSSPIVREGVSDCRRSVIIRTMSPAEGELDAIQVYDEAKASSEEAIPFVEAIKEIEDESNDHN